MLLTHLCLNLVIRPIEILVWIIIYLYSFLGCLSLTWIFQELVIVCDVQDIFLNIKESYFRVYIEKS